jgi:2-keto-4-pentenoate hydratase
MTQEQQQIQVTDADWLELFRRMPQAQNELNRVVSERVEKEMMQKRIEELEGQKSNGVGDITADFIEAK